MNMNKFDDTLKASLERFEAPLEPNSWALFEQKMNAFAQSADNDPGERLDDALRHGLERAEQMAGPADWSRMARQLDNTARLRRRVLWTKVAEAAVFLLLLLNFGHLLSGDQQRTMPGKNPEVAPQRSNIPMASLKQKALRNQALALQQALAEQNTADNNTLAESLLNTISHLTQLPVILESATNNESPVAFNSPADNGVSALDPALFYQRSGTVPFHELVHLTPPAPQPVAYAPSYPSPNMADIQAPTINKAKSPWYAATYALYQQDKTDFGRNNQHGGGVAAGYRKGKWGIETGVQYAAKSYEPKKKVEIYAGNTTTGFYGTYVAEANAEIVSVPLKVTRRMARLGKTSVHAVAGVTGNAVMRHDNHNRNVFYPGLQAQQGNNPTDLPGSRTIENGLAEQGSWSQNTFASLEAGLRVERPLNTQYTAFVEPVYRRTVGGKGFVPTNGIRTVGVQAGVMAFL